MWYFLIKQDALKDGQYQQLLSKAVTTEVELFSEPYTSWYVFTIERKDYQPFMEWLDLAGVSYESTTQKPTRQELLGK